jgi:MFS family permease
MAFGSVAWGSLSDRLGPRPIVLAGSAILAASLAAASLAPNLFLFQLIFGVLVGGAVAAIFAPMMACVTGWFDTHRSLAVSLVSAGMGVAPMTVSPFARWLITAYDWRTAMLVIGVVAWAIVSPTALFIRRPPAAAAATPGGTVAPGPSMTAVQALRSPEFIILALTFFFCCGAHSGPIFHMVSYAISCGVAPMAAVSIYSVEGLAGLGGRLLFGVGADRLGVKRVLVAGLLAQAVVIAGYAFINRLTEFYSLAVIFGMVYGGVMPLYATLAREYFGPRIMGTVLGAATLVSSIGMASGPPMGGGLFANFAAYTWLFLGAGAVGSGAVAIALAFPPLPAQRRPTLQPA